MNASIKAEPELKIYPVESLPIHLTAEQLKAHKADLTGSAYQLITIGYRATVWSDDGGGLAPTMSRECPTYEEAEQWGKKALRWCRA